MLDPARPTEASCVALLQFENGAAASLVYSGYDHFDSDEWHFGIGERGAPKTDRARRRAPRACRGARTKRRLRTENYAYGSAHRRLPPHQPHFGITIVTCADGDMRASADGVTIYDRDGMREIPIPRGDSMPGRREVLDDMRAAIRTGRSPVHDGRWGKATVEVALAILQLGARGPRGRAGTSGGGGRFAADRYREIAKSGAVARPPLEPDMLDQPATETAIPTARTASLVVEDLQNLTFSVHRKVFVSPEILEDENRAIFDKCWIYVGHASEMKNPGDFRTRHVAGRR